MEDQGLLRAEKTWVVGAHLNGIRLDAFVRYHFPQLSRRSIEAAIDAAAFRINRQKCRKGDRLTAGDVLNFVGPSAWIAQSPIPEPRLEVPVVFEDADLLVIDKPAGMDTHGFSGRERHALANFLAARWPELTTIGKSPWEPGLVHRLDRETSGLIVVAKSQAAYDDLRTQFRCRTIRKKYRALVWGEARLEGSITLPITHDRCERKKMRPIFDHTKIRRPQRIWHASTRFRRLATGHALSFLEIDMETGVTHQIRVHLAAIGHPIVGDLLYGVGHRETFGLKRHFLHACRLEFRHPRDGRRLRINSRLPDELEDVLRDLGVQP
jgi:23S rRNA pseudouridine1911/1915/1917 synthase